jgi:hypothetical protein
VIPSCWNFPAKSDWDRLIIYEILWILKQMRNFWLKLHEFFDASIEPPKNPQLIHSRKQFM